MTTRKGPTAPTKHQMAVNCTDASFPQPIKLDAKGRPVGAGARKLYNRYMRWPKDELERAHRTATKILLDRYGSFSGKYAWQTYTPPPRSIRR